MINLLKIFFLVMSSFQTFLVSGQKKTLPVFKWAEGAVLPPTNGNAIPLGLAGAIQGVNKDVLIIAGGSNFPAGLPWKGGKKVYYNRVYILKHQSGQYSWNKEVTDTLPEPMAYSGCTSTPEGVVFAGGQNDNGLSCKCYLVTFDESQNRLNFKKLPNLPLKLTNAGLTHIDNKIYVAGGDEEKHSSKSFFCFDLLGKNSKWDKLPDLPVALANATVVSQNYKNGKGVFVIGGRTKTSSGVTEFHSATFAFNPQTREWKKCADISDGQNTVTLAAGSGVALDDDQILLTGGDNGKVFHEIESLELQINQTQDQKKKNQLTAKRNDLNEHHKGFDRRLFLYNTKSDRWMRTGQLPFPAHVTTTDVIWDHKIVISNGEKRPGIRTPLVMIGEEE